MLAPNAAPQNGSEALVFDPENIEADLFSLLTLTTARKAKAVPFMKKNGIVCVGMVNPNDFTATDEVEFALNRHRVAFYRVEEVFIQAALTRWARFDAALREGETVAELTPVKDIEVIDPDSVEDDNAPVAHLVNQLLDQAIDVGASDVHFQPNGHELVVKFRVDGVLRTHQRYPFAISASVVNRIKIMGDMDIAERRKPLDGRFNRDYAGRSVDCRVVSIPTAWEVQSIILRLLDRTRSMMELEDLGFHDNIVDPLKKVLRVPDGLILVTGPTGSGKTTTLYAALSLVATPERNTLAIEDPVEIRFPTITQVQVNEPAGLTFTSALRSFLRADPDVMLVGEIRDEETAELSVQAAQTGHLVLSTLHANNASSTPTRMSSLSVNNYDISTSVRAILAQRLVRKVCNACRVIASATPAQLELLDENTRTTLPQELAHANPEGCAVCDKTGYKGRLLVGELIVVTPAIAEALSAGASSFEIQKLASEAGTLTLHEDAVQWLRTLDTTIEELDRMGLSS